MREYELIIDKALLKGLSPESSIPFNDEWLWQALGFRVGRKDLEGYEVSHDTPLAGVVPLQYSWPFPQWFSGERYNFLVVRDSTVNFEDKVYVLTDDYVATHIFDIDVLTFGTGTLMEVADFGEYAVMLNGVLIIFWDVGLADWHEIRSSATFPMMKTICNFKGQAVGGNVQGIWNGAAYDAWHDCDETFYCWSKIGSIDFTPEIDNTAGYRRDPYGGEVYHTRRLGDNVIGYSSKGITLMTPVSSPAATFGFTELDDVGLINKGAMDGSLRRQVYVGTDYILREITSEGVKELGYQLYISDLDTADIIVNYDRIKKDFYISDGTTTFLLSPYGLTQVPQHPSAIWSMDNFDDEPVMLPNTVDSPYVPSIVTTIFDMGYRGQKTIFSVESDVFVAFNPTVSVGWMNTLLVWGYGDDVPLNNEGVASVIASGNEFIVQFKFELVARTSPIKYIKVRYKMTDLRGIRGVYAPPPRGQ